MLTAPDKRFSVSGGFCLLVLWFWSVNGWIVTMAVLSAAVLHELGHWCVLVLFGGRGTAVRLSVFGAEMQIAGRLSYGQELAVVLSGPIVNLLCGTAMAMAGETFYVFAGAHLALGLFNLLPVCPLDGGRTVQLAVGWVAGPAAGARITGCVGCITALAVGIFLLWLVGKSGGSLWLFPAAGGMLLSAGKEMFGK